MTEGGMGRRVRNQTVLTHINWLLTGSWPIFPLPMEWLSWMSKALLPSKSEWEQQGVITDHINQLCFSLITFLLLSPYVIHMAKERGRELNMSVQKQNKMFLEINLRTSRSAHGVREIHRNHLELSSWGSTCKDQSQLDTIGLEVLGTVLNCKVFNRILSFKHYFFCFSPNSTHTLTYTHTFWLKSMRTPVSWGGCLGRTRDQGPLSIPRFLNCYPMCHRGKSECSDSSQRSQPVALLIGAVPHLQGSCLQSFITSSWLPSSSSEALDASCLPLLYHHQHLCVCPCGVFFPHSSYEEERTHTGSFLLALSTFLSSRMSIPHRIFFSPPLPFFPATHQQGKTRCQWWKPWTKL